MVKYTRKTKRITRRGITCRGKRSTGCKRINSRRQKKGG